MGTNHTSRIAAGLVLAVCVLFTPWWLTLILAIVFAFAFPSYYEAIFAGVAMDLLYNVPRSVPGIHNEWLATEIALALFIIMPFVRKRIISLTL